MHVIYARVVFFRYSILVIFGAIDVMIRSKVVYNGVCPYCDGQIMSIYIGRKRMSSVCIKCNKEAPKYVVDPRPVCTEERLGRLMAIEKRKEKC